MSDWNPHLQGQFHISLGKDGKSAYEIAVAHGFVGTEEEWLESLHALINGEAAVRIAAGENVEITLVDGVLTISAAGEAAPPYLSLERKAAYLYEVTFGEIPPDSGLDSAPSGGCTTYVSGGRLLRNLDLGYTEQASFRVRCSGFEGTAVLPGLTDTELDDALIGQLPYHLTDGVSARGIMVSEHVLYNDFGWHGSGSTPLTKLPYLILTSVRSMATLADDLADVLPDLCATPALDAHDYLLQYLVTDGETTCAILPPTDGGDYVIVDVSANPKLTNFRWVESDTVDRADLQTRPTGVERWNAIPAALEDLRFTAAYESPGRLSEFIGLRGTTKASTDAELLEIYADARAAYLARIRDGTTWQTVHSVVYAPTGLQSLCVQEDWTRDYAAPSGSGGTTDHRDLTNRDAADQHPIIAITGLTDALDDLSDVLEALADLIPDNYIKDASVSGNTLTLTMQDDSTLQFTPQGGESGLFVCTYGTTTFAQITAALEDGKQPVCLYNDTYYVYAGLSNGYHCFSSVLATTAKRLYVKNTWGSATFGIYEKKDGGIPKTDLSSEVQNSLKKADAAYSEDNPPPYPVTSVNSKTGDIEIDIPDTEEADEIGIDYTPTEDSGNLITSGAVYAAIFAAIGGAY